MTKFETVGVNLQAGAWTKDYALKMFDHSCYLCSIRGLHIDCDHCHIKGAHELVVAAFDSSKGNKKED